MVGEDEQITIQEISEVLDISLGCVSNILNGKLCYSKVSARWIPRILMQGNKTGRVAYSKYLLPLYDNCDPNVSKRSSLVMKHGCTVTKLRAKHSTEHGCQNKEKNPPQITIGNRSHKKVLCTMFFNKWIHVTKTRRRASFGNTERVYAC